ncbi:MAG: hypothetical protein SOI38_08705 [Eggerthellaceae bacterium]|jgi:hypothetical protein
MARNVDEEKRFGADAGARTVGAEAAATSAGAATRSGVKDSASAGAQKAVAGAAGSEEQAQPAAAGAVAADAQAPASDTREDPAEAYARMTPDERALAENNALAQVIDDVRAQSAAGVLVTPERWVEVGFVPPHMTGEEFEMFVYDRVRLEMDREREERKRKEAAHPEEAAERERESQAAPHVRSRYRTATHAVGVPKMFGTKKPAAQPETQPQQAPSEQPKSVEAASPATQGAAAAPTSSAAATSKPDAAAVADASKVTNTRERARLAEETSPTPALYEPVPAPTEPADPKSAPHRRTLDEVLSGEDDVPDDPALDGELDPSIFDDLDLPEGYRMGVVDGEYVLVPTEDKPQPKKLEVDASHITAIEGRYSYYLYDAAQMTESYAHWAFLAGEGDDAATLADVARQESRLYPRPMDIASLMSEPFGMTREHINAVWQDMQESGAYPDIARCEASNGDVYFYSTKYLNDDQAQSLAEWQSVGRAMNV